MKFGKTIKIFLIDGDPNGRMTCELSNWSGKAYKIPRIYIKDCGDRPDLQNTGVYLLFGKNEDGKECIYIGEAETVLKRLNQHIGQKDFWNEAIVFISKDDNLNKAHIKYIENRLFGIAGKAKRYAIENAVIPTKSTISESDCADMEEFISNIKMLVNTLGHKVFEDKREMNTSENKDVFCCNSNKGTEGFGKLSSDGFVVFKGSKLAKEVVPSVPKFVIPLRENLIQSEILVESEIDFVFTEDYLFSSPSNASTFLLGRSSNGLVDWKLSDGRTLKEVQSSKDDDIKND